MPAGRVVEVLPVLPAGGVRRVGAGGQRRAPAGGRPPRSPRSSSSRNGSSCGCPSRSAGQTPGLELALQGGEQRATLLVDRALAPEQEVVLTDLGEPLPGNAPTAGDVLQERHHLLRTLGAAEGHQQDRLVRFEAAAGRTAQLACRTWLACVICIRVHSCGRSRAKAARVQRMRREGVAAGLRAVSAGARRPPSPSIHRSPGLVARLPMSMTGIGIVLLVSLDHRIVRPGRVGHRRRHGHRGPRGTAVGSGDRPDRPGPGADRRRDHQHLQPGAADHQRAARTGRCW